MLAFIVGVLIVVAGLLGYEISQPVEVASVTYSLDGARLMLSRSYVLNLSERSDPGSYQFASSIFIPVGQEPEGGLVDRLRNEALFCGGRPCTVMNPVVMELKGLTDKLDSAKQALGSTAKSFGEVQSKMEASQQRFSQMDCGTQLEIKAPERPALACDVGAERGYSEGLCLVLTLGPDACAKYSGDEMFGKIAASEGCSTAAAMVLGEVRSDGERQADAVMGVLSHGSDNVLKSAKDGNFFAWLLTPYAMAVKMTEMQRKYASFKECVPKAMEKCSASYAQWQGRLSSFQEQYGPVIAKCGELAESVRSRGAELERLKAYHGELQGAIQKLEADTVELRSKQVTVQFVGV